MAQYVNLVFDRVLNVYPDEVQKPLPMSQLHRIFKRVQISGIQIPGDIAEELESLWSDHLKKYDSEEAIAPEIGAVEEGASPKHSVSPDGSAASALSITAAQVNESGYFSLASLADERSKILREIVERRGQPEFRNKLIATYRGRCAVTGCDAIAALEAAHILRYSGPKSHHVTNGLLLRADIHTLFDIDLIGIDPESLTISVAPAIKETMYAELHGRKLSLPRHAAHSPNREALTERWKRFGEQAEL